MLLPPLQQLLLAPPHVPAAGPPTPPRPSSPPQHPPRLSPPPAPTTGSTAIATAGVRLAVALLAVAWLAVGARHSVEAVALVLGFGPPGALRL